MAKIIKMKDLLEGGKGSGPQKGGKSLGGFFADKLKKNIDKYNKKAKKPDISTQMSDKEKKKHISKKDKDTLTKLSDLLKNEGKVNQSKVNQSFTRVIAFVRKEAKKLNDDDLYAMTQKLAKWFK